MQDELLAWRKRYVALNCIPLVVGQRRMMCDFWMDSDLSGLVFLDAGDTLLMCSTMSLVVFFSFLFFPFFFNPKTYSVPRGTPKFSLFKVCKRHVAPVWIWLSDWCVSVELKNFWKQFATFPAAAWRMSTCHCDHCVQSPLNWIVHWIGYLFMVYHCTCTELITIDSRHQRSWRNCWEKFKQEAIWIDVLITCYNICQIVLS